MKHYKQLTLSQRYQIQSFLQVGLSQIKIAQQLGVHRSTISRELKRNIPTRGQTAYTYVTEHTHGKTNQRHTKKPKSIVLTPVLKKRIAGCLNIKNEVQNSLLSAFVKMEKYVLVTRLFISGYGQQSIVIIENTKNIRTYTSIYVIQVEDKNEVT